MRRSSRWCAITFRRKLFPALEWRGSGDVDEIAERLTHNNKEMIMTMWQWRLDDGNDGNDGNDDDEDDGVVAIDE